jgi:hypothetical protein
MAFDRPPAGAEPNIGLIVARGTTPRGGLNIGPRALSPSARDAIFLNFAPLRMSEGGQTEKTSVRAYVFRFTLKLGHRSMQSPCLKRAMNGSRWALSDDLQCCYGSISAHFSILLRNGSKTHSLLLPIATASLAAQLYLTKLRYEASASISFGPRWLATIGIGDSVPE